MTDVRQRIQENSDQGNMTMLDGLLDRAPEIIAPHLDTLLTTVCDGADGQSIKQWAIPT